MAGAQRGVDKVTSAARSLERRGSPFLLVRWQVTPSTCVGPVSSAAPQLCLRETTPEGGLPF